MAGLDDIAAMLRSAVRSAQDDMARRETALLDSLPGALSGLFRPAALRVRNLTLDLTVLVEEVADPTLPGGIGLALRIGGAVPDGARCCRLTLDCVDEPPGAVHVAVDGQRFATLEDGAP